jgi:hypothetical protein
MTNRITIANLRPRVSAPSDELLPGVRLNRNKFQAWLCIYGKNKSLGSFSTNIDAGVAWLEAKVKRDSSYLEDFKNNLSLDVAKLKSMKEAQARENKRDFAA